jgi:hypothetical protein
MNNTSDSILSIIDRTKLRLKLQNKDNYFSDQFIYDSLLDERNLLMYRELNKKRFRSKWIWNTICMPLVKSKDIPCDCVPAELGCIVLKSKYKLPTPLSSLSSNMIKVLSLDGYQEYSFKDVRIGQFNKYTRLGKAKAYFTIYNNYLYIVGESNLDLPAVLVELIPRDPTELDKITLCDVDGEHNDTCFNPLINSFNVENYLVGTMIDLVIEKITGSLKLPNNTSNDQNELPAETKY